LPQYEGFFAEFYDILHSSYDADLNIYLDLAKQHGDPALELGCGTGRLLIPLAAAGHAVTGLDLSRDMLTKCQEKLDIEGEATAKRVSLVQGDIRRFELGRKFNLIIAACNTILHCTAVQDLLAVLARAREHLAPGGVFAVDFSIPNVSYDRMQRGRRGIRGHSPCPRQQNRRHIQGRIRFRQADRDHRHSP